MRNLVTQVQSMRGRMSSEPLLMGEGGTPSIQSLGHSIKKKVGIIVNRSAMIFPALLKFFVWFNKNHENTDISSTENLNLVGKHSSFTDSCSEFTYVATIFHLVK